MIDVFRASCGLCVSANYQRHFQYNCQHKALQASALPSGERTVAKRGEAAAGDGCGYVRAEGDSSSVDVEAVEALLSQRVAARRAKEWSVADGLLAQLHELGVEVSDKPEPSQAGGARRWCGGKSVELLRRGDWTCPNSQCGINCFASRLSCFKCHTPKPTT
eukprot:COSAG03_NODE_1156_length_4692_cov_5.187895_4_plen_162_part_00